MSFFSTVGLIFALSLCASAVGTWGLIGLFKKRDILDRPNERSSHTVPTPSGGGIAIMATLGVAWIVIAVDQEAAASYFIILGAAVVLAGLSFLDDLKDLRAGLRFAVQGGCVVLGVFLLPEEGLVFQGIFPMIVDRALCLIGWLWFLNLYNFMDGIDGITAVETAFIALGIVILSHTGVTQSPMADAFISIALCGAVGGFLIFNRAPAKIFMGDVGAIPIGFILGWFLLNYAANGQWVVALILPGYYLADATLTLLRRLRHGERIWQAHRSHFYQAAARGFGGHRPVVLWVVCINIFLLVCASAALYMPAANVLFLGVGVLGVICLLLYFRRVGQRSSDASSPE